MQEASKEQLLIEQAGSAYMIKWLLKLREFRSLGDSHSFLNCFANESPARP